MRKSSRHWLAAGLLALSVLGGPGQAPPLHAQAPPTPPPGGAGVDGLAEVRPPALTIQRQGDLLRLGRDVPGDAKPILLDADNVTTWTQGDGKFVLLLSGQVLVQQSIVQGRFQQAVAWIDMKRYQATGLLHMDLYAEGQVHLDAPGEVADGSRAVLNITTRGELRLRASRGKVQRQDRSGEALVSRGRGMVGNAATLATPMPSSAPAVPTAAMAPPARSTPTALPPVPGIGGSTATPPFPSGQPVSAPDQGLPPVTPAPPVPPASPAPPRSAGPVGAVRPAVLQENAGTPGPTSVQRTQFTGQPDAPARLPVPSAVPDPVTPTPMGRPSLPPPPSRPLLSAPSQSRSTLPPPRPDPMVEPGVAGSTLPPPAAQAQPLGRFTALQGARADKAAKGEEWGAWMGPKPPDEEEQAKDKEAPRKSVSRQPGAPGTPPAPMPVAERPLEHRILPRSGETYNLKIDDLGNGQRVITITGGLILNVRNVPKIGVVDVEADRAVVWVGNRDPQKVANRLGSQEGEQSTDLEFYMSGHVIMRTAVGPTQDKTLLEASELYYDARRNVSIALNGRLELRTQRFAGKGLQLTEPIILQGPELFRTGPNTFELNDAEIFSSKLPSDPGFKLLVSNATLTNRSRDRVDWFGNPVFDKRGNPVKIEESIIEARDVISELEGIPISYFPYLVTDARDPMGPLQTITFGGNRIYGFQTGVGLNLYKLLGVMPIEGTRFRVLADYLSRRGPALGSLFDYAGKLDWLEDTEDPLARAPTYTGNVRVYGIHDAAQDILGGNRPYLPFDPPGLRGRAQWRQSVFDLPGGFSVQSQMSLLSDRNFLEQYFKREFDLDPNQSNYIYAKQQQDNWAVTALGQVRQANWITTTEWLPRVDGYLIGQPFFNLFTSNTQVSAGYARLLPSSDPPQQLKGAPNPPGYPEAFFPTDQRSQSGRFAIMQELALPLDLGPVKFVPYAKGALIEYTKDLNGNEVGRAWGGLGARASMPLTRLYPEIESELLNLHGINHKMVFGANYLYARSNEPYTNFAQFDRLNDDATASMLREFKPQEPLFNKTAGFALATSPLFDPQRYAIRRLVDNRFDTLDDINVLQLDLRQRWQTKRGYPGYEHIVDAVVLNSSISLFPQPDRDNFGKSFSFAEYQYLWNIGDRTSLESTAWYDPQENGAKLYTVGMYFNRPDRTTFYLGYRQIDPLQSRMVTAAMTYVFSPKYAMTFSTSYDLGTSNAQNNSLVFTRTGTDLQVSMGFTYNSLQKNFGAILEIVPSLVPMNTGGLGTLTNSGLMGR